LESDGYEYTKKEVQSFVKRSNVLIASVENWPNFDDSTQNYEEILQILKILQFEMSETIKLFMNDNTKESKILLSKKGRIAVEKYLGEIE
jgi:hypothetical protein